MDREEGGVLTVSGSGRGEWVEEGGMRGRGGGAVEAEGTASEARSRHDGGGGGRGANVRTMY
jgi:hypothetical protein